MACIFFLIFLVIAARLNTDLAISHLIRCRGRVFEIGFREKTRQKGRSTILGNKARKMNEPPLKM